MLTPRAAVQSLRRKDCLGSKWMCLGQLERKVLARFAGFLQQGMELKCVQQVGRLEMRESAPKYNILQCELILQFKFAKNESQRPAKEAPMTAETFRRRSDHGVTCNKCGISLIAPEWSYDFSEEQLVINLWSCTKLRQSVRNRSFCNRGLVEDRY